MPRRSGKISPNGDSASESSVGSPVVALRMEPKMDPSSSGQTGLQTGYNRTEDDGLYLFQFIGH